MDNWTSHVHAVIPVTPVRTDSAEGLAFNVSTIEQRNWTNAKSRLTASLTIYWKSRIKPRSSFRVQTPACTVRAVMKTSKRVLLWRFSPNDHERIGGGDSFICNSISLWIRTVLTRSGWFLPQIWILLLKTREPQLKKKHTPRLSCTDSLIIALADIDIRTRWYCHLQLIYRFLRTWKQLSYDVTSFSEWLISLLAHQVIY